MSCDFSVFISHGLYGTPISAIANPLDMYSNIHFIDGETCTMVLSILSKFPQLLSVRLSFKIMSV